MHLLHAGNGLLLPQWSRGEASSHEGGDGRHPGGHHGPERVRVRALHIGPTAVAQVGLLLYTLQ